LSLSDQRKMAKAGMVGSLGALFASGFFRFKGARMFHPWFSWVLNWIFAIFKIEWYDLLKYR
jgi:hypothetical protein